MKLKAVWSSACHGLWPFRGVSFYHDGLNAVLTFDYSDYDKHTLFKVCIKFKSVLGFRNYSEYFGFEEYYAKDYGERHWDDLLKSYVSDLQWGDLYIVVNSKELEREKQGDPKRAKLWDLKHYVILFDSAGLFEFFATDFEVMHIGNEELKDFTVDDMIKVMEEKNK